jgi:hypothetical protein
VLSRKTGRGVVLLQRHGIFVFGGIFMSKKTWIALGALIVVLAIMVGVFVRNNPQAQKGNKAITITVVHGNGTEKVFTCRTDAEYLDEVVLAEGIIPEGNIVDGMFTVVDGETASWEADQAYWALFIGEDYAVKGICDTVVEDGGSYKFVYEKSTYWGE